MNEDNREQIKDDIPNLDSALQFLEEHATSGVLNTATSDSLIFALNTVEYCIELIKSKVKHG